MRAAAGLAQLEDDPILLASLANTHGDHAEAIELLEEARRAALRDGTTLRELVERGLRQVLQTRRSAGQFKLRKASFRGKGLQEPLRGASWDKLRELA